MTDKSIMELPVRKFTFALVDELNTKILQPGYQIKTDNPGRYRDLKDSALYAKVYHVIIYEDQFRSEPIFQYVEMLDVSGPCPEGPLF